MSGTVRSLAYLYDRFKPVAAGGGIKTAQDIEDLIASIGNTEFTATGSLTVRSIADRAGNFVNIKDFGAVCDGTTDDHVAFSAAVARINTLYAANVNAVLYIPAGRCYINAAVTQFAYGVPGKIQGDGTGRSFIIVGTSLTGSVFSWSDAWGAADLSSGSSATYRFQNGASVRDLTMIADQSATNVQTALAFTDRNDFVVVEHVQLFYFHGAGISIGDIQVNVPVAFMRESKFSDVLVWGCGTASVPAVLISTTASTGGQDATNEIKFYGLDIQSPIGKGLVINGVHTTSDTRLLQFYGLRIEGGADDPLTIGDGTLNGVVHDIFFYGLQINTVPSGKVGLHIIGASIATSPGNIFIRGGTIRGVGKGVVIAALNGGLHLGTAIGTTDTELTVGASSLVQGPIIVDTTWPVTTSIDSTSTNNVSFPAFATPGQLPPVLFKGTATGGGGAARLTIDGLTAQASNSLGLPDNSTYALQVILIAVDTVTPAVNWTASWGYLLAPHLLTRGTGISSTKLNGANSNVAPDLTRANGTVTGIGSNLTADQFLGCLYLDFTAPTGNAHLWDVNAIVNVVLVH